MDQIFDLHDYPAEKKAKFVTIEFKGYALTWWNQIRAEYQRFGHHRITWEEMKRELRRRFASSFPLCPGPRVRPARGFGVPIPLPPSPLPGHCRIGKRRKYDEGTARKQFLEKKNKKRNATRGLPRRSPILVLLSPKHA